MYILIWNALSEHTSTTSQSRFPIKYRNTYGPFYHFFNSKRILIQIYGPNSLGYGSKEQFLPIDFFY